MSQRKVSGVKPELSEVQGGDCVATKIVSAVAEREGVEPTALDTRLYEAIDPDALSTLVDGARNTPMEIGFDYAGYHVTVVVDDGVDVDVTELQ